MLHAAIYKQLPHFPLQVDLQINKQILVLVGPSGAGKTTVLQCIAGLIRPDRGEISIDSRQVFSTACGINLPPRQRQVGYVFQDYALFPHLNILKNVMYGIPKGERKHRQLDADEVMHRLKISHLKHSYPQNISGGEKQRVALARSLMTSPELLLLDEPLSALDFETRACLQKELREVQRVWQIPFVVVTHDLQEAEILGDHIVRIDRGRQLAYC